MTNSTETATSANSGAVRSGPRALLRVEGLALLAVAILGYSHVGAPWLLFALLFLAPDLFMAGYLAGPRIGALAYNFGHTTVIPLALGCLGYFLDALPLVSVGLIWLAHVGFDRAVGYGLKYPDAFRHTHLGAARGGGRAG